MQKLCSTCEGEKGRLLTGEHLGAELLMSAKRKQLEPPVAKGLACFFRRMTSGIVLGLAVGKALDESRAPSPNMHLFTLGLGSLVVPLPSVC